MKGMMSLLERAGLVRQDDAADDSSLPPTAESADASAAPEPALPAAQDTAPAWRPAADAAPATADGQSLDQIYAAGQVPASVYPAERLLRLMGGLSAMDEATRRQTIHAIDAADESWTIDDPISDAAAKVSAIEQHSSGLRTALGEAEAQAQAELANLRSKQETTVAEIRRQIADLEGLLAREIARGAQELAAVESGLQSKKDSVSHELASLSRTAGELRGLIGQFKTNVT